MMDLIAIIAAYELWSAYVKFRREPESDKSPKLLMLICAVFLMTIFSLGFILPSLRSSYILGRYLVLVPFLVAFITDGGAYFVGVTIGKHRPFPNISPKKSVEGFIGGIVIGTLAILGFAFLMSKTVPNELSKVLGESISPESMLASSVYSSYVIKVNYVYAALCGFVGAVVTEAGDLLFSWIKRKLGIKDYGNLIPGHGGMLDRFDSMIVCAPIIALICHFLPFFSIVQWVA